MMKLSWKIFFSAPEAFLEYRPAVGLNADSFSKVILNFRQDCCWDLNNLVGHRHDGSFIHSYGLLEP